ncbi:MAG: hypothetical protein HQL49_03785 [Gammaproteobacteria bacterium]|nr:hypothetical protein [Gammaproteobacteria bacterium]
MSEHFFITLIEAREKTRQLINSLLPDQIVARREYHCGAHFWNELIHNRFRHPIDIIVIGTLAPIGESCSITHLQLIKAIHTNYPNAAIILITHNGRRENIAQLAQEGIDHLLIFPYSPNDLLKRIHLTLGKQINTYEAKVSEHLDNFSRTLQRYETNLVTLNIEKQIDMIIHLQAYQDHFFKHIRQFIVQRRLPEAQQFAIDIHRSTLFLATLFDQLQLKQRSINRAQLAFINSNFQTCKLRHQQLVHQLSLLQEVILRRYDLPSAR